MDEHPEAATRRGYDPLAEASARALPDLRAETRLDLAVLDELLDRRLSTGPVLDMGCGSGRVAAALTTTGFTARTRLDRSPEGRERQRQPSCWRGRASKAPLTHPEGRVHPRDVQLP
jgi:SAM-dependent methyltransferase